MSTSSAVPEALEDYAGHARDLDGRVADVASRLNLALAAFRNSRPDYGAQVLDGLEAGVRVLASATGELDWWVGDVSEAFRRADNHPAFGPFVPGQEPAVRVKDEDLAMRLKRERSASDGAAERLARLAKSGHSNALDAELRKVAPYLSDLRFAAALFKRLGPKRTFELLTAAQGRPEVAVLGRALVAAYNSGAVSNKFLDGILDAARQRASALDAYVHPWGSVDERDRVTDAQDEYMHRAGSPPGTYKLLESTAPLLPYLEAGARVAIIGGAVVIVSAGVACVALSVGSCLGPAAAFAEEGAIIFSSEAPSVPTGLFETLPMSMQDEATFGGFIDQIRTQLPQFLGGVIRGSSATGVRGKTGELFDEASDIDLGIVDSELWKRAEELSIKFIGGGTRTLPLSRDQLAELGLRELQAELSEIAGHDVSIMLYRSMDDILARGPAIVIPPA